MKHIKLLFALTLLVASNIAALALGERDVVKPITGDKLISVSLPNKLRCEFLSNPMGIEVQNPALSWNIADLRRGAKQTAYQIQVASSEGLLGSNKPDLWDSGKIASDQSHLVAYQGKPLLSGQRIWWRVQYWDQAGKGSGWSEPTWWEMGLLNADDWKAKWIHADLSPVNNEITEHWLRHILREDWTEPKRGNIPELYRKLEPAPRFRREFEVKGELLSARLYISGLGYYTAWLNGTRVGDCVMAPAQTDYDRRILYDIYDVTTQLKAGKNVIGVELGDGWYNQVVPKVGFETYGKPVLRAQLEITTSTGKYMVVTGDGTWKAAAGPLLKNDLHTGEVYDARLEQAGWNSVEFNEQGWLPAQTVDPLLPKGLVDTKGEEPAMTAQLHQPERRIRTISPVQVTHPKKEVWVFHFAERISGRVSLTVTGLPAGTQLTMRVAETLIENDKGVGEVIRWHDELEGTKVDKEGKRTGDLGGMIGASQNAHVWTRPDAQNREFDAHIQPTSVYVARGGERETWENEYSHQPFQYVELRGYPEGREPAPGTIKAVVVYTDTPVVGTFSSSDRYLNTFEDMFRRTFRSCFHGTLADNPGAERTQWFGHNEEGYLGFMYHTDMISFVRKQIRDIQTMIDIHGKMRAYAPGKRQDGDVWALSRVAPILLSWDAWICYGDEQILKEHYSVMRDTMDSLASGLDSKSVWRSPLLGDWCDVNTAMIGKSDGRYPRGKSEYSQRPLNTPAAFTETAKIYEGASRLAVIAAHLGYTQDAQRYRELAAALRKGLNSSEFYDAAQKTYGSQGANGMAVDLGFAPADDTTAILDWVHRDIERWNGHFTVGLASFNYFLSALSDHGQIDDVFKTMTSAGYPGFRHMVDLGQTTVCQSWDGDGLSPVKMGDERQIDKAFTGSAMKWLYNGLAGIKPDPSSPGWKHFFVQPGVPAKLDSVAAETQTPYGQIKTNWKKSGNRFELNVTVPPNSTATVKIPVIGGAKNPVIKEGAALLSKAEGVTAIKTSDQEVTCQVQSGSYSFSYDLGAVK